jgi:hypothetical protein
VSSSANGWTPDRPNRGTHVRASSARSWIVPQAGGNSDTDTDRARRCHEGERTGLARHAGGGLRERGAVSLTSRGSPNRRAYCFCWQRDRSGADRPILGAPPRCASNVAGRRQLRPSSRTRRRWRVPGLVHGDSGQLIDGQRDASVSGPKQRAVAGIGEVSVVRPAAARPGLARGFLLADDLAVALGALWSYRVGRISDHLAGEPLP